MENSVRERKKIKNNNETLVLGGFWCRDSLCGEFFTGGFCSSDTKILQ